MINSPKASQLHNAPPSAQPLTERESDHLDLLQHLQRLIQADPREARDAMEMSQEHLPEIYPIARNQPQSQWPQALMNSDSMHSLLNQHPRKAKELLQYPDLQSLLEQVP